MPEPRLYARKDFPQRLGVALVVLGFVGSSIAWANYHVLWTFAILFVTALVDLLLYIVMGESLTCYRCSAQYRGFEEIERHGGFDLETHERYRQMAARLKETTATKFADTSNDLMISLLIADCGLADCGLKTRFLISLHHREFA